MPMRSAVALIAMAGLLLVVGQSRAGPAADSAARAELRLVPLESPGAVVARHEAEKSDSRLYSGILLPSSQLSFGQGVYEFGFTLGGAKASIEMHGKEFSVITGGQTIPLRRSGMGFAPVSLKNESGGEYLLAFPMGYTHQMGGILWTRSGGVMRGNVGDAVISLFDDNLDGRYLMSDDGMRIGSPDAAANVFAPLSKFIATPTQVLEITSLAEDGSNIDYTVYGGQIGKLAVSCEMPDSQLIVVMGSKQAQLNVVATATPNAPCELAVIPGEYQLLYGAVYSTTSNAIVALLGPGTLPPATVSSGQTAQVGLGAPLHLEFTVAKPSRNKISIDSSNFKVMGKAGELYRAVEWAQGSPPTVSARRGSTTVLIGKMSFG